MFLERWKKKLVIENCCLPWGWILLWVTSDLPVGCPNASSDSDNIWWNTFSAGDDTLTKSSEQFWVVASDFLRRISISELVCSPFWSQQWLLSSSPLEEIWLSLQAICNLEKVNDHTSKLLMLGSQGKYMAVQRNGVAVPSYNQNFDSQDDGWFGSMMTFFPVNKPFLLLLSKIAKDIRARDVKQD